MAGLRTKNKNLVLWRHTRERHGEDITPPNYRMTVTSSQKDALSRQIEEAVRIGSTPGVILINTKMEFGHHHLPRVSLTGGI